MMTITATRRNWWFMLAASALLSVPLAAQAAKTSYSADFVSTSGCTETEVSLSIKSDVQFDKAETNLWISQVDVCTEKVLISSEAKNIKLKDGEFTDNTLNTVFPVKNMVTGQFSDVTFLVTFEPASNPIVTDTDYAEDDSGKIVKLAKKLRKTLTLSSASGQISMEGELLFSGQAQEAFTTVLE